jgi:hypothetical protein
MIIGVRPDRHGRSAAEFPQVAEADGNRTRLRRGAPHTGFEDRGGHQAPRRLRDRPYRCVGAHDAVVVDVENPRAAGDLLGNLVHVSGCGQAGADVDELPDPVLLGEDPHHPAQERPVGTGDERQLRHHLDELSAAARSAAKLSLPSRK